MKKAWIFLIVVALLALSVPVFADEAMAPAGPTVKFSMLGFWWANYDPSIAASSTAKTWPTMNGGAQRIWPTADVVFDANNTLEIGLRWAYGEGVVPGSMDFPGSLWHFMWTSDLTGALGMKDLSVDVKVTIGQMDSVLTNWWYDNNGWEWEYGAWSKTPGTNWDAGLITINGDSNFLGYGLAVGVGPVIFHWVQDFQWLNTLVGAEASYMGFGVFVAYGMYTSGGYATGELPGVTTPTTTNSPNYMGASTNNLAIEAKYDVPQIGDLKLTPSVFFRDAFAPSNWVFGGDVTIGYQMFKLIVGATTTSTYSLQHYSGTLFVNPVDPVQLWIAAYFDGAASQSVDGFLAATSSALQGVDIGASCKFGAFKLMVGWFVAGLDQLNPGYLTSGGYYASAYNLGDNVTLANDNVGKIRNGLYFGSGINF